MRLLPQWRVVVLAAVGTMAGLAFLVFLAFVYLWGGHVTGYFEGRHEQDTKAYRLPNGEPLADEVVRRLASNGVSQPLTWGTTSFNTDSIVSACVPAPDGYVCLNFELNHRHAIVVTANPLAAELFPELGVRGMPLGWNSDRTDLKALGRLRRRTGDIVLSASERDTPRPDTRRP